MSDATIQMRCGRANVRAHERGGWNARGVVLAMRKAKAGAVKEDQAAIRAARAEFARRGREEFDDIRERGTTPAERLFLALLLTTGWRLMSEREFPEAAERAARAFGTKALEGAGWPALVLPSWEYAIYWHLPLVRVFGRAHQLAGAIVTPHVTVAVDLGEGLVGNGLDGFGAGDWCSLTLSEADILRGFRSQRARFLLDAVVWDVCRASSANHGARFAATPGEEA